jgi:hypothetical protein
MDVIIIAEAINIEVEYIFVVKVSRTITRQGTITSIFINPANCMVVDYIIASTKGVVVVEEVNCIYTMVIKHVS